MGTNRKLDEKVKGLLAKVATITEDITEEDIKALIELKLNSPELLLKKEIEDIEKLELSISPKDTPKIETDYRKIKDKAIKDGLAKLSEEELIVLADEKGLDLKSLQASLLQNVYSAYCDELTKGKPIGKVLVKKNIIGYKKGSYYPVDKELKKFFEINKAC